MIFERGENNEEVKIKKGGGRNIADRKTSRNIENPKIAVRKPEGGKMPEKYKTSDPLILKKLRGGSANEHQKQYNLATYVSKSESHMTYRELKEGQESKPTLISSSSRPQISDTGSKVAEGNPGCEEHQLLSLS